MILTFALNQVKHIPTVTVEGYCKNATKKAFAAAHKKLRNDPTTWPAEWTMMTEDIRKWPAGDLCVLPLWFKGIRYFRLTDL